jgi:hypothetical protein
MGPSIPDQEYPIEDLHIDTDDGIPSLGQIEVNSYGEFHTRACATHVSSHSQATGLDECIDDILLLVDLNKDTPAQYDFNRLKPYFGFASSRRIQKTI